jgi:hypothetical protein
MADTCTCLIGRGWEFPGTRTPSTSIASAEGTKGVTLAIRLRGSNNLKPAGRR